MRLAIVLGIVLSASTALAQPMTIGDEIDPSTSGASALRSWPSVFRAGDRFVLFDSRTLTHQVLAPDLAPVGPPHAMGFANADIARYARVLASGETTFLLVTRTKILHLS